MNVFHSHSHSHTTTTTTRDTVLCSPIPDGITSQGEAGEARPARHVDAPQHSHSRPLALLHSLKPKQRETERSSSG